MERQLPKNLLKKSKQIVHLRYKYQKLNDQIFDTIMKLASDSRQESEESELNFKDTNLVQFDNGIKTVYNYSIQIYEYLRSICMEIDLHFDNPYNMPLHDSDTIYTWIIEISNLINDLEKNLDSIKEVSENISNLEYYNISIKLNSKFKDIKYIFDEIEDEWTKEHGQKNLI